MATSEVQLTIRVAWWFKYYLMVLFLLAECFDLEPNEDKIHYWADKAMIVEGPKGAIKRATR